MLTNNGSNVRSNFRVLRVTGEGSCFQNENSVRVDTEGIVGLTFRNSAFPLQGLQWSDFVALQTTPSTEEAGDTSEPSSPKTIQDAVTAARGICTMDGARKKEAIWDLFQTECMFLYDHLMVLKNVSRNVCDFLHDADEAIFGPSSLRARTSKTNIIGSASTYL